MKLVKSSNGKTVLSINKNEWYALGKNKGWITKQAKSERLEKINEFATRILGPEGMDDVMKDVPEDMKDEVLNELRRRKGKL